MKVTSSSRAHPELLGTEHRLSAVVDGVEYAAVYILPNATYKHLDPAYAIEMVESHLWKNLMRTIEDNLRKNLTHA